MSSDPENTPCVGHEAEELRHGIEKALEDHPLRDMGDFENMRESLCRLLDRVDAGESLQVSEEIAGLRVALTKIERLAGSRNVNAWWNEIYEITRAALGREVGS